MYLIMKNFFFPFFALLLLCSCSKATQDGDFADSESSDSLPGHEMIVLGRQLDDPYSVENMTKALEALYPTKADRINVDPTHLYVRFLPSNEKEYDALLERGLDLLDHPLDYEIVREGDYYHDPSVEEGKITWQYAVVSPCFDFGTGVRYEILDRCHIPVTMPDMKSDENGIDWEAVERKAYEISGNASRLQPVTKAGGNSPKGRITIVDEELSAQEVGVKGVMVSCNSFVKFGKAYTDEEGRYQMSTHFSSKPRYRLCFKNKKGFCIGFNLLLVPASVSSLGKGETTGLDCKVTKKSDRMLFTRCVVNNSAYDYYEQCLGDKKSIPTPPANLRIWLFQALSSSSAVMLQQGACIDSSVLAEYLGQYLTLVKMFLPDVTLGIKSAHSYRDIYATTVHELSHASHYMAVGNDYWDAYATFVLSSFVTSGFVTYGVGTEKNHGYCEVGEMWAYYMQSSMVNERYQGETKRFYGMNYWFHPQILLNLEERGLDRYKIFAALGPDVVDKEMLRKKLLSLYPEFKSAITQAFARYF